METPRSQPPRRGGELELYDISTDPTDYIKTNDRQD